MLERRFVLPARMDVEQQRVANRPERVNAQAPRLLARGREDLPQRFGHRALVAGPRVKSREDDHLAADLAQEVAQLGDDQLLEGEAAGIWRARQREERAPADHA